MPLSEDDIREIADQLRQPHGENGLKVAEVMLESNFSMIQTTVEALQLKNNAHILEIGHGNCGHLQFLFSQADNLQYKGLELSELMHKTALLHSQNAGLQRHCEFSLYEGNKIPFPDNTFDAALTINTLYFWEQPKAFLKEICRVMKPGGRFALCFGLKSYMSQLPFTKYNFTFYNTDDVTEMVSGSQFNIDACVSKTETVKGKTGESVERTYVCMLLKKQD